MAEAPENSALPHPVVEVSTNNDGLVSVYRGRLAKWTPEGAMLFLKSNINVGEDVFLKLRNIETSFLPLIGLQESCVEGKIDFESRARVVQVVEIEGGARFLIQVVLVGSSRILGPQKRKSGV